MSQVLDRFISEPDVKERFSTTVAAPSDLVFHVASNYDMQSPWIIRSILWMRSSMLGSKPRERPATGLVEEMIGMGWACLEKRDGELFVAGAVCEPWQADVNFVPLPADQFCGFSRPGLVKIAWTLEVEETGPGRSSLASETRAVATDALARRKFCAYWRWARFGIIAIRKVLLAGIRRAAEREWREQKR